EIGEGCEVVVHRLSDGRSVVLSLCPLRGDHQQECDGQRGCDGTLHFTPSLSDQPQDHLLVLHHPSVILSSPPPPTPPAAPRATASAPRLTHRRWSAPVRSHRTWRASGRRHTP